MYLYHFNLNELIEGPQGKPYTAILRVKSDGSTILNPAGAEPVAPVIDAIAAATINAGFAYTGLTPILLEGTLPVTWSLVAGPQGMTINFATGVVSWPEPTVAGSPHTVTIRAENAVGSDDDTWLLTVVTEGGDIAPLINEIADASINAGFAYTGLTPSLSQGTEPVTWSLVEGPVGMEIASATGVVTWDDPTEAETPYTVTIRVENSVGSDDETWLLTVTVEEDDTWPIIRAIGDVTIAAGVEYTGPRPTMLQGIYPMAWSLVEAPSGMLINTVTGQVYWPDPVEAGSPHTVRIRVENEAGFDDESWDITVVEGYIPPEDYTDMCSEVHFKVAGKEFVTELNGEIYDVVFSKSIPDPCPMGGVELIDPIFGSLGSFKYDTVPDFNVEGIPFRMEGDMVVQDLPNILVLQFTSPTEFVVYIGSFPYEGIIEGEIVSVTGLGGTWDFSWALGLNEVSIEGIKFHRVFGDCFATAPVLVLEPKNEDPEPDTE
jgi:hypothetical protein